MTERKYGLFVFILCALLTPLVFSPRACAQQNSSRIAEEKRKALNDSEQNQVVQSRPFAFDYGVWVNYRYSDYSNMDNDKSAIDALDEDYTTDIRVWAHLMWRRFSGADIDKEHSFYIRLKHRYENRLPEETAGGYDVDGAHVDYSYLTLDFRPCWIQAGRKYYKMGRGIAYGDVNDGFQVNYLRPGINLGILATRTLPGQDNIDTSVPGYLKDSERFFYGLGVGYTKIKNHQLYGYALVQQDCSDEDPNVSNQQYTYNSQYWGIGSVGVIIPQVQYWMEVIKETGKSYVYGSNAESRIDAWAANCGIEVSSKIYSQPKFSFEYAYGSGDKDRQSVTDTEYGNITGDDNNFLYFGYFNTGFATAPRLSNLHVIRFGVTNYPFQHMPMLENLTLDCNYFRFYKDKVSGAIYDTEAILNEKYVGQEVDASVSWEIFSDLSVSVEYGYFMPGDAFSEDASDPEEYFSVSSTINF